MSFLLKHTMQSPGWVFPRLPSALSWTGTYFSLWTPSCGTRCRCCSCWSTRCSSLAGCSPGYPALYHDRHLFFWTRCRCRSCWSTRCSPPTGCSPGSPTLYPEQTLIFLIRDVWIWKNLGDKRKSRPGLNAICSILFWFKKNSNFHVPGTWIWSLKVKIWTQDEESKDSVNI